MDDGGLPSLQHLDDRILGDGYIKLANPQNVGSSSRSLVLLLVLCGVTRGHNPRSVWVLPIVAHMGVTYSP